MKSGDFASNHTLRFLFNFFTRKSIRKPEGDWDQKVSATNHTKKKWPPKPEESQKNSYFNGEPIP
jgi:hypothetical protein